MPLEPHFPEQGQLAAPPDAAQVEPIPAEFAALPAEVLQPGEEEMALPPRRRRLWLPVILFLLTCVSTFFVGASHFNPYFPLGNLSAGNAAPLRQTLIAHWQEGLIYMACVLAILVTHEMGHFLATLWYRIPASFPYCLPLPFSPIGTLGAVIGMDSRQADRRQMFDVGIAGPLAGLVVAIPIMWIGVGQLDLREPGYGMFTFDQSLAVRLALANHPPPGYEPGAVIWLSHVNPFYMAGWVGLLITGLNMLPVSQLDGGHVIYALFGKGAHWIARTFMVLAIAYVVYNFMEAQSWILMIFVVLLIGTDHPPTRDDTIPLGWFRTVLGYASLAIPVLCFAPRALMMGAG
jgi:Zn-dependent protease